MSNEIWHHGIKGQKWGVRRFQNPDGTLKNAGKQRYSNNDSTEKNVEAGLKSLAFAYRFSKQGTAVGAALNVASIASNRKF